MIKEFSIITGGIAALLLVLGLAGNRDMKASAEVMPFFRQELAKLPEEKKSIVTKYTQTLTGQDDYWTGKLMKAACWGMDSETVWKFQLADTSEAESILQNVLNAACERLAEKQAAGRC